MKLKFFDSFTTFITHKLKTNSQTGISKVCYKIGIISTTVALAFTTCAALIMNGFHANIENRLINLIGDINITNVQSTMNLDPIDANFINHIVKKSTTDIVEIKKYAYKIALLQHNTAFEGVTLYGLDNEKNHENIKQFLSKGSLPNENSTYENEIVISEKYAQKLNLSINDSLVLCILKTQPSYKKVKICGIYNSNFPDFDEKFAFCDIRLIQKLNSWTSNKVSGITIFLKKNKNRPLFTKSLNKKIQTIAHQNPLVKQNHIHAQSIEDLYYDIFSWISILRKNTLLFITLLLIVINTNLVAVISIQIINNIYTISVLKSLGTSIRQLTKIFTKYNLEIILKGVLYGNILGLGLSSLQSYTKWIKLNPETYYIDHIPIKWDLSIFGLINLTIITTSVLILIFTQIIILKTNSITKIKNQ